MTAIRFLMFSAALALIFVSGFAAPASAHDETASPQHCPNVPVGYCYWCPRTESYPGHVHCTEKDWCVRVLVCIPGTFAPSIGWFPNAKTVAAGTILP